MSSSIFLGWTFLQSVWQWPVWAHETWTMFFSRSFVPSPSPLPRPLACRGAKSVTSVHSNFKPGLRKKSDYDSVMMWYKIFNTLWNLFENTLCYFDPLCEELGRGFLQIFMFYVPPPLVTIIALRHLIWGWWNLIRLDNTNMKYFVQVWRGLALF